MAEDRSFWVLDSSCPNCQTCGEAFSLSRRKHHCRNCGCCVCFACSEYVHHLPDKAYTERVKVCLYCHTEFEAAKRGIDTDQIRNFVYEYCVQDLHGSKLDAQKKQLRLARMASLKPSPMLSRMSSASTNPTVFPEFAPRKLNPEMTLRQLQDRYELNAAEMKKCEDYMRDVVDVEEITREIYHQKCSKMINELIKFGHELQETILLKLRERGGVFTVATLPTASCKFSTESAAARFLIVTPAPNSLVALTGFLFPQPGKAQRYHKRGVSGYHSNLQEALEGQVMDIYFTFIRPLDQSKSFLPFSLKLTADLVTKPLLRGESLKGWPYDTLSASFPSKHAPSSSSSSSSPSASSTSSTPASHMDLVVEGKVYEGISMSWLSAHQVDPNAKGGPRSGSGGSGGGGGGGGGGGQIGQGMSSDARMQQHYGGGAGAGQQQGMATKARNDALQEEDHQQHCVLMTTAPMESRVLLLSSDLSIKHKLLFVLPDMAYLQLAMSSMMNVVKEHVDDDDNPGDDDGGSDNLDDVGAAAAKMRLSMLVLPVSAVAEFVVPPETGSTDADPLRLQRDALATLHAPRRAYLEHMKFQKEVVDALLEEIQTKVDAGNEEHQRLMQQLWRAFQPTKQFPGFRHDDWKSIGFQGENPFSDFRGMGLLSVKVLIYMGERYPSLTRRLVEGQETKEYPLCTAGINVTAFVASLLTLNRPGGYIKPLTTHLLFSLFCRQQPPVGLNASCYFHEVVVHLMALLDRLFVAANAGYMQFPIILAAVQKKCEVALEACPVSLPAFLTILHGSDGRDLEDLTSATKKSSQKWQESARPPASPHRAGSGGGAVEDKKEATGN